jgi:hypothetical protein
MYCGYHSSVTKRGKNGCGHANGGILCLIHDLGLHSNYCLQCECTLPEHNPSANYHAHVRSIDGTILDQ